jgi:23S rRNA pseudouridine2605 synthase
LPRQKTPQALPKTNLTAIHPEKGTKGISCRLNKAVAAAGIVSRRDADELIKAGKVSVNGAIVTNLATVVTPGKDLIQVEGKTAHSKKKTYVALYKPKGVITSCEDEKNRKCVLDLLPPELKHLKPVGRLDRDSAGLLIMTNDGELAYALTHPSQEVTKTYIVTTSGSLTAQNVQHLSRGIHLSDGLTRPAKVRILTSGPKQSTFEIVIREGRNRQIRRMCSQLGLPVVRLLRVAIGGLQLKGLKPGTWRLLSNAEITELQTAQIRESIKNR